MDITILCDQVDCVFNKMYGDDIISARCTHNHPYIQHHPTIPSVCNSKQTKVTEITNNLIFRNQAFCDHVGYDRHTLDSGHTFCVNCGNLIK